MEITVKIDEITQINLLYDFYGQLLTRRQREVVELYHGENLSLAEIAQEFSISRQGVYDTLKKGEKALRDYEEKLGLVEKFRRSREAVARIDGIMDQVIDRLKRDGAAACAVMELTKAKDIIDQLED